MLKPLLAACAAIAVPFSAGIAADDGMTKTLTDNYYQQSVVNYECGQYACSVAFPATTAAVTEITDVSCSVVLPTGTQIQSAALISNGGYGPSLSIVPQVAGAAANVFTVVLNGSGKLFYTQGAVPTFFVGFYTVANYSTTFIACTITGFHS